jgi:hypothetical protein
MYRVIDRQGMGTMESRVFKTKADIVEALASYHSIDFFGLLEDREATIYDYLKQFKTIQAKLDYLSDYGDWEIETIRKE